MYLPLTIKEIQAGYLASSFFKDLHKYLAQNVIPHKRHSRCKVEALAESFILFNSLLFKLVTWYQTRKGHFWLMPENCADKIIELYHSSLFTGHQGVIKTYLTISDKFFIPHLMHYLRSFLSVCHICQLFKNDKPPSRQLETRINLNYRPVSKIEHGSESNAQITERAPVHPLCDRWNEQLSESLHPCVKLDQRIGWRSFNWKCY